MPLNPPAQIFVSCGQNTPRERAFAERLKRALEAEGFSVYVAISAQSLEDVNSWIIRQLERSDYYVFVDFRREKTGKGRRRGSLFTHQELAIAHRSSFERILFFQETGTSLEGLLRYMGSNPKQFERSDDLVEMVCSSFRERKWTPAYSRHLIAARLHDSVRVIQTPRITGRFFFVDIENRRTDAAAYDTLARLESIEYPGGVRFPSPNRSPLKVTGQGAAFSQVVWPSSHGAFDVLAIGVGEEYGLYLHTSLDLDFIGPTLTEPGHYELEYGVLARDFPILRFVVSVSLTGDPNTTRVELKGPTQ